MLLDLKARFFFREELLRGCGRGVSREKLERGLLDSLGELLFSQPL